MDNNYEDYDVSDEYLADKLTSEQYAEAARQANQQSENPVQADNGVRQLKYEPTGNQNDDVMKREQAFRQSLENNTEVEGGVSENTNQYDLDDFDVEQEDEAMGHSYNRRIKRASQTDRRQAASSHKGFFQNKQVKEILGGFRQIFSLLFSKRPMQVFHLNLHWGVLGILALTNILLIGAFNSLMYSKSVKEILDAMKIANLSGTGTIFGISLLSQLATLVLMLVLLFLMAFLLKSESRKFKQFVQTLTLSTVPYTLTLILAIIITFFFPVGGMMIAVAGKMHAIIYLYAGFQKGHPTKKNSPFWIFLICLILILTLQAFFVSLAIA